MVSRIDRLFILLDTGSNESVRLAAAKQLGEVQRVQPNDLEYLLRRIQEYSSKSVWDTRIAAGHATRCVLEQIQPFCFESKENLQTTEKYMCHQQIADRLLTQHVDAENALESFDLDKLSAMGIKFLSLDIDEVSESTNQMPSKNSGSRYNKTNTARKGSTSSRNQAKKSDTEQLMRQRKLINKELGIAMVDSLNLGVSSTDIVSNDDLQSEYDTTVPSNQSACKVILQSYFQNYDNILNSLKEHSFFQVDDQENLRDHQWPLAEITKKYTEDMFNPSWEFRHGAAIALREIVRLQGRRAGRLANLSETNNDRLNQIWLVDMALRAISLLALDKFGDFLFDQVVAPVRENGAQLLGCCIANMTDHNASLAIKLLLKMLSSSNWETRHGGILGLKYSLSVLEESLSEQMLKLCYDPILKCLADPVDDVAAEAAAALEPVKNSMMKSLPERMPELVKFLWDQLADLDELTTSTSNIVLLLASLITSSCAHLETKELTKSIPRLWSLLNHSSTSVRVSVLKALITLIKPHDQNCLTWMPEELISIALRLIYQRSLLENSDEVRKLVDEVWMLLISIKPTTDPASASERFKLLKCTSQYLNYWLCLVMLPSTSPIDRGSALWLNINPDGTVNTSKPDGEIYLGSSTFNAESINLQKLQVTKCRLQATKLLGGLYSQLINDFSSSPESQHAKDTLKYLSDMFVHYLDTKSANQRMISGWTIESWASHLLKLVNDDQALISKVLPGNLTKQMYAVLNDTFICYDELASAFTRLQQETREFVSCLKQSSIEPCLGITSEKKTFYNLVQIQSLCDINIEVELTRLNAKKSTKSSCSSTEHDITKSGVYKDLTSKKANLTKSLTSTKSSQKSLSISVLSSLSCAHIAWRIVPASMELVSEPLLDSIELETDPILQEKSAEYLVTLIDMLSTGENEDEVEMIDSILDRIIDNLDSSQTSRYLFSSVKSSTGEDTFNGSDSNRIILLDNLRRQAERGLTSSRRQSSVDTTRQVSASNLKRSHSISSSTEVCENEPVADIDSESSSTMKLGGVSCALTKVVRLFAEELPDRLPKLWATMFGDIAGLRLPNGDFNIEDAEFENSDLIRCLRLLEVVAGSINDNLHRHLLDFFHPLIKLLKSPSPLIRHHSSQCIGIISRLMFSKTIDMIKNNIIPLLDSDTNTLTRCGAIEAIACILEQLQLELVPHINMFIIHILKRMSDQDTQVRLMATHCFGKLLSLMPLNLERSQSLKQDATKVELNQNDSLNQDQERFMEQLLNPKKLENFETPFKMRVELRSYQQEGLNWLAFMNKFNLHGILCDEMGLGKTFMTICMVASDHYSSHIAQGKCAPSLIVCPPTLTEHWLYELYKFLPEDVVSLLEPIAYFGNITERMSLRARISGVMNNDEPNDEGTAHIEQKQIGIVVASYDIVRNDIEFFKDIAWNYCVLDEGHIIKNVKTKLSRSIRQLKAKHRLILSGTPIQNNVTELWSLFDFLMPGFLGSERQFNVRYAKPILLSREIKCSPRDLESGALAMESLHRQVLPFILRRLKEDVLADLPPKIIQDYYCELSPLQSKLYEDFTRSRLCNEVTKKSICRLNDVDPSDKSAVQADSLATSKDHVFQALQYLKNVCNHPKLVLSEKHSQFKDIKKYLEASKSSLDDITHSSKLKALKQLLVDCGIGTSNQPVEDTPTQENLAIGSVVNQHRALVFCQVRSMINIIENDLLKKHLPSTTYLKLDGSVPTNQRHSVVSRFNNDPSIDILLITTQIGGLGLNLTGADTVIFVEHDWNPTKDLQAMDRAHRIGQKKVVNVYRLITKGTLEEKILGLQKFKTMVSNTVINQDNIGLSTMGVDQLLDLFEVDSIQATRPYSNSGEQKETGSSKGKTNITDMLPELWDERQYESEYDLTNFVSSLKN